MKTLWFCFKMRHVINHFRLFVLTMIGLMAALASWVYWSYQIQTADFSSELADNYYISASSVEEEEDSFGSGYPLRTSQQEELATAGEKIASINDVAQALNPPAVPHEAAIPGCLTGQCPTPRVQDYQYESAQCGRSQMEDRIERTAQVNPLVRMLVQDQPSQYKFIEPHCVGKYMEGLGRGFFRNGRSNYQACGAGEAASNRFEDRPCISEKYVNLMTNSFNLAGTCLSYIPEHLVNTAAKLFPHESGYHINAVCYDGTGACGSGVGQLISMSIEDVNRRALSRIRSTLASSPIESCRAINSLLMKKSPPLESNMNRVCDRLTVEKGNPLLNIIYSMALLQLKYTHMENAIFNQAFAKQAFASTPPEELYKIREAMVMWSYNIGEKISDAFAPIILAHRNRPIRNAAEFIEKLRGGVHRWVASAAGANAANAKAKYIDLVRDKFNQVDQAAPVKRYSNSEGETRCLPRRGY